MELVRGLAEQAPDPFPPALVDALVAVMVLMRSEPTSTILQSGADCLAGGLAQGAAVIGASYVPHAIIPYPSDHDVNDNVRSMADEHTPVLQMLLETTEALLAPDVTDNQAMFSGKLVAVIALRAQPLAEAAAHVGMELDRQSLLVRLWQMTAQRLALAKLSLLTQGLLTVFTRSIAYDEALLVEFLCSSTVHTDQGSESALVAVLRAWVKVAADLMGQFNRKICFAGLARLLSYPEVHALIADVKVEIEADKMAMWAESLAVVTRSQRKKMMGAGPTTVPLASRMLQLVVEGMSSFDEEPEAVRTATTLTCVHLIGCLCIVGV